MQDPERWTSDPNAPAGMGQLLRAAKTSGPSAAEQAALGAKLGLASTAWWLSPIAKVVGVAGLVVGVGAGSSALLSAEQTPDPLSTSTPTPLTAKPSQAAAESENETARQDSAVNDEAAEANAEAEARSGAVSENEVSPTIGGPSARAGAQSPTEAELLSRARSTLTTNPERALSLLSTHARLYPAGVLSEERELLKVRALKQTGRNAEAAKQAEQFRESHPDSVHHLPK